jgi:hypothetical protein
MHKSYKSEFRLFSHIRVCFSIDDSEQRLQREPDATLVRARPARSSNPPQGQYSAISSEQNYHITIMSSNAWTDPSKIDTCPNAREGGFWSRLGPGEVKPQIAPGGDLNIFMSRIRDVASG